MINFLPADFRAAWRVNQVYLGLPIHLERGIGHVKRDCARSAALTTEKHVELCFVVGLS